MTAGATGTESGRVVAVVLAAGKGTRMRSELPKVLHEAAGWPLLGWVLDAARRTGCEDAVAVVGHRAEEVQERFEDAGVRWVVQAEQLGTGHALAQAEAVVAREDLLLVLSGDVPLVRPETLQQLVALARAGAGAMVVAEMDEPGSLGRVLDDGTGGLAAIVEAADASPEQLQIRTINAGIYALPAGPTFDALRAIGTDNAQGELYLTDAVTALARQGRIALHYLKDPDEATGVNTRAELARVDEVLMERRRHQLFAEGVSLIAPSTIRVGPDVEVAPDVVLHPQVQLSGRTRIATGVTVHQGCWIRDSSIESGSVVHPYSVLDRAEVGPSCQVGPFARLRPAARLEAEARVGNFVEVKNAVLGAGAKASHLTYLGDAEVGAGANIGAGVVTCNYDGVNKHRTQIGKGAFVGSDTMLVAPVTVGDGATTGAGSVITKDVPNEALAVGRARQRNIPEWTRRPRPDDAKE